MKRILLITLHDANTGNRLQHYALQTVLEKRCCEVVNPFYSENGAVYKIVKKIKSIIKLLLYYMGIKKYYLKEKRNIEVKKRKLTVHKDRNELFNKFDDTYIHNMTDVYFFYTGKIKKAGFDLAITGSDQVWHNWEGTKRELHYFYLMFTHKDKRASYAPSFGFSEFPEKDKRIHQKGLSAMKYLSCRESEGSRIIKELTGRDAPVLPDPTMLLSKEEWKKISRKPDYDIPEKFMLVYFLGDTDEYEKTLSQISRERECGIVNIYSPDDMNRFCTDPCEFLWLAENADCICTDSFHACVFSIIFERPFMAFQRKGRNGMDKMFDRIENLLSSYGLESHIRQDENSTMLPIKKEDNIPEKLKANARKGLDYIDNLLSDI